MTTRGSLRGEHRAHNPGDAGSSPAPATATYLHVTPTAASSVATNGANDEPKRVGYRKLAALTRLASHVRRSRPIEFQLPQRLRGPGGRNREVDDLAQRFSSTSHLASAPLPRLGRAEVGGSPTGVHAARDVGDPPLDAVGERVSRSYFGYPLRKDRSRFDSGRPHSRGRSVTAAR